MAKVLAETKAAYPSGEAKLSPVQLKTVLEERMGLTFAADLLAEVEPPKESKGAAGAKPAKKAANSASEQKRSKRQ